MSYHHTFDLPENRPAFKVSPVAPVLLCRSDPAKSTMFIFPTRTWSWPSSPANGKICRMSMTSDDFTWGVSLYSFDPTILDPHPKQSRMFEWNLPHKYGDWEPGKVSDSHTLSQPFSRISTVTVKIEWDLLDSLFIRVLATLRFFCPTWWQSEALFKPKWGNCSHSHPSPIIHQYSVVPYTVCRKCND